MIYVLRYGVFLGRLGDLAKWSIQPHLEEKQNAYWLEKYSSANLQE